MCIHYMCENTPASVCTYRYMYDSEMKGVLTAKQTTCSPTTSVRALASLVLQSPHQLHVQAHVRLIHVHVHTGLVPVRA